MACCSCFIQLLIFLVALANSITAKPNPSAPVIKVTKHLSFPDFNPKKNPRIPDEITLLGNAKLSPQDGIIQIPDSSLQYQAGRAIYSSPIRLFDPHSQTPASFTSAFSFQINTTAGNQGPDSGGSGLTFIVVPDQLTVGRPGPWLAMLNDACDEDYKIVAVEFDTRQNVEFGDPNDNHIGINLGSVISTTTINASDAGVSFKDGSVHRAWINYDGRGKQIDIRLGSDSGDYPQKPLYSAPLDLSPFLNEYMFVGFSASTGNLTQIHSIVSWNFSSASEARLRMPSAETCEEKLVLFPKVHPRKPPNAFLVFIAVVVLCLVVLLNFYCNGKTQKPPQIALPDTNRRPRPPNKPRKFSFSEISVATRGFSDGEILGNDWKGIFYKGSLQIGCNIAVKRFSAGFFTSPGVDRRKLTKEISKLSRVRHPNLVPVRGWCCEKRETMVVYDYVPNGSLDKWLFARGVVPWSRRFKILRDVGEGLCFLHGKKLCHKNVKTSSVLLDVSFRAMLGDFGFVFSCGESAVGQKVDVFEFGMMGLEIVAGRRRKWWDEEKREMDILDFVWRMKEEDEVVKVVDRRLGSVFNVAQAVRVIEIGLLCTGTDAKARPGMEEVVELLNMEKEMPELPLRRPVAIFGYNSTTDLCSLSACAPFK